MVVLYTRVLSAVTGGLLPGSDSRMASSWQTRGLSTDDDDFRR